MSRIRSICTLGVVMFALASTAPIPAQADTFPLYGPPNAAAWALSGHSVSGGAGDHPKEYPGPQPWDQPAGDYCTAYKFGQPNAPARSAPLATVSDTDLTDLTGFDPGLPREAYQMRHNGQADSSACQANGATWGFWANAGTHNNHCDRWCGVRHDWSTGQAMGTRPWSNGYPDSAKLVISAQKHVQSYSGSLGIAYLCAMLHDTTTSQRLEYCFRVWRSWTGAPHDAPIVFANPHISNGAAFTTIVTDLVAAGTPYAEKAGGGDTVTGTVPSGDTYAGAITRSHLVNAINDANAIIKSKNFNSCGWLLSAMKCYSTDPDSYALFGVEDGLELLGSGTAHLGGYSTGLRVYTDY